MTSKNAAKFDKPYFSKAPEAFDAVDLVRSDSESIDRMIDAMVLLIAEIDDAVIGPKTVGMDNGSSIHLALIIA